MYQTPPTLMDIINKLDLILKEQADFIEYLKNKDKAKTFSVACKCGEVTDKINEVTNLIKQ